MSRSWTSSPSRKRTGLSASRGSSRNVPGSARAVMMQRCASSLAWLAFSAVYVPSSSTITLAACSLQITSTHHTVVFTTLNSTKSCLSGIYRTHFCELTIIRFQTPWTAAISNFKTKSLDIRRKEAQNQNRILLHLFIHKHK